MAGSELYIQPILQETVGDISGAVDDVKEAILPVPGKIDDQIIQLQAVVNKLQEVVAAVADNTLKVSTAIGAVPTNVDIKSGNMNSLVLNAPEQYSNPSSQISDFNYPLRIYPADYQSFKVVANSGSMDFVLHMNQLKNGSSQYICELKLYYTEDNVSKNITHRVEAGEQHENYDVIFSVPITNNKTYKFNYISGTLQAGSVFDISEKMLLCVGLSLIKSAGLCTKFKAV